MSLVSALHLHRIRVPWAPTLSFLSNGGWSSCNYISVLLPPLSPLQSGCIMSVGALREKGDSERAKDELGVGGKLGKDTWQGTGPKAAGLAQIQPFTA